MGRILFITGTDTGVGKTELTVLLTRFLRARGDSFRSLKPFCSGSRSDARRLRRAQGGGLRLEEVNPWFYRAPLAPGVAAELEGRACSAEAVLALLRAEAWKTDLLVVEGAGGLLSPLAGGLDSRELLVRLRAIPVLVAPDRLGAINQCLLAWEALPPGRREEAVVVLSAVARPDASVETNGSVLASRLGPGRLLRLPRLEASERRAGADAPVPARVRPMLRALLRWVARATR
jgi:dethiobiotin synthetase